MPRSALTGTEKKGKKEEISFQKKLREDYIRENRAKRGLRRHSAKALKDIAMGKGGPTSDISKLMQDFKKSESLAKEYFEPVKKAALNEYHQNVTPGINTALGSSSKSSSALNQALAASGENLKRNLASDFAGLQMNLGQNLLQQSQQAKLQKYNAMLQAGGAGLGQTVVPQGVGLGSAPSYLSKAATTGIGQRVGGGISGGVSGAASGAALGSVVPGIGTVVGGVGGGILGLLGGSLSA